MTLVSSMGGYGLRPAHYPYWRERAQTGELPWLEVMADNFLFDKGGPGLAHLDSIARNARCVVHGVGLSIASPELPSQRYVKALGALCDRVRPHVVSDHLCFTHAGGFQSYDLLPIPYTDAFLRRLVPRVLRLQESLGRRFAFENVSSYVSFHESEMTELEFLGELCQRTGCGILLDVNNVFVSAVNHAPKGTSLVEVCEAARSAIAKVDAAHVMQYHVAGHTERDGFLYDTHDAPVKNEVWNLCGFALSRLGLKPLILEHDDDAVHAAALEEELAMGFARMGVQRLNENGCEAVSLGRVEDLQTALETPEMQEAFGTWQEEFLDCVQSPFFAPNTLATTTDLASRLCPATAERLEVYRLGYYSRVSAVLADTLFEKASVLVSKEYVSGILGRFREQKRASQESLTACCDGVSNFARLLPDVEEVPWLPDFMDLCLFRWKVLTGADPLPLIEFSKQGLQLGHTRLQANAAFVDSRFPLFSLWKRAENEEPTTPEETPEEIREETPEAVLLFKSAPTDLEMVLIEPSFKAFVMDLLAGKTILEAIEGVESRGEDVCPDAFEAFLAALSRRNAWTHHT